jgi:hypothetical protein
MSLRREIRSLKERYTGFIMSRIKEIEARMKKGKALTYSEVLFIGKPLTSFRKSQCFECKGLMFIKEEICPRCQGTGTIYKLIISKNP